jgi:alpha-ketoglutarate-dependent taurine dioxygenase
MAALGVTRFDVNPEADDDGVTSLTPKDAADLKGLTEYIPYSASAINWHTDGYYNTAEHRIRSLALHCVRQAADGGDNDLLDHEMAYLMLRDRLHDFVTPLFAADAMTIPRREENGVVVRPDMPGPVFIDEGGALTMRYTHRTRSIRWKTDEATTKAVAMLRGLLEMITPYHFRVALEPGWGLVCNNVLHARTAFSPASDRLLYRLRYYDRVAAR